MFAWVERHQATGLKYHANMAFAQVAKDTALVLRPGGRYRRGWLSGDDEIEGFR